jgi:alkylated DNA repair dioxygenase AlkB
MMFKDEASISILPYDGEAILYPTFIHIDELSNLFQQMSDEIDWKQDEVMMFGKKLILRRKSAFYSDHGISYTYSHIQKKGLPWTNHLLEIKQKIESEFNLKFNACLLNYYHDGSESMGWHSDDEVELGTNPVIASLSLGAERSFQFKHKLNKHKQSVKLNSGSLLIMKGSTQHHWLHSLPKSLKIKTPRINLTFRFIQSH